MRKLNLTSPEGEIPLVKIIKNDPNNEIIIKTKKIF